MVAQQRRRQRADFRAAQHDTRRGKGLTERRDDFEDGGEVPDVAREAVDIRMPLHEAAHDLAGRRVDDGLQEAEADAAGDHRIRLREALQRHEGGRQVAGWKGQRDEGDVQCFGHDRAPSAVHQEYGRWSRAKKKASDNSPAPRRLPRS